MEYINKVLTITFHIDTSMDWSTSFSIASNCYYLLRKRKSPGQKIHDALGGSHDVWLRLALTTPTRDHNDKMANTANSPTLSHPSASSCLSSRASNLGDFTRLMDRRRILEIICRNRETHVTPLYLPSPIVDDCRSERLEILFYGRGWQSDE